MVHKITKKIYDVLYEAKFDNSYVGRIEREGYILKANIHLCKHKERSDLEKLLNNLKEEVAALDVKIGKVRGKRVEVLFGMRELEPLDFSSSFLHPDSLKVELPSAFGSHILDFEDGASCHMLNGGVTRMGKTCLLLYLATVLYLQMEGKIQLYISSAKLKDYYPFQDLPKVKMAKSEDDLLGVLESLVEEYKSRDDLLYSPRFRNATDAKGIRKHYPESYHLFEPVFLIIDEYARFAETKAIQKKVTELVETAGFVNIHVIIASQRPDASTVLKPRIKANLLTRLAFTTADKKNSEIILDRYGAEELGRIAGRGMLIDSESHIIQVPFLDPTVCDKVLSPYRQNPEVVINEQDESRSINTTVVDKIQGLIEESDSLLDLSGEYEPNERSEQGSEKNVVVWGNFPNSKGEG